MAEHSKRESRRKFLKAVPAAMAGAVGAKALAQAPQPNGGPGEVEAIEAPRRSSASICIPTKRRRLPAR